MTLSAPHQSLGKRGVSVPVCTTRRSSQVANHLTNRSEAKQSKKRHKSLKRGNTRNVCVRSQQQLVCVCVCDSVSKLSLAKTKDKSVTGGTTRRSSHSCAPCV